MSNKKFRQAKPNEKIRPHEAQIVLPALLLPSFRTAVAIQEGVERKLLMKTWGGIGDQICAEPTIRFALESFKDCEISLASERPELFTHLKFKEVYNLKREQPHWDKHFVFSMIHPIDHIQWEFMSHMITHCVDYPSLCAFRCQLPVKSRELQLKGDFTPKVNDLLERYREDGVVIHPGRHWQSKTFPAWWWEQVIERIQESACIPIIIGGSPTAPQGTVDISTAGCVDLRDQLSIMESVALLQKSKILLTNDSSPLHMAASGRAWIGFVATCKHPDYIMHWRNGAFGWRMENLGKGGVWDLMDYCPNRESDISAENVGEVNLLSWLPEPKQFAQWAIDRMDRTD